MFFNNQHPGHGMFNMGGMSGMGNPNIQIFHNGRRVNVNNMRQKPMPIQYKLELTLTQSYNGVKVPIEINKWVMEENVKRHDKETLYIDIPRGIDNNEIIVLKDRGNVNQHGLVGDVKIMIDILNDSEFRREGLNLIYKKDISLKDSLCGFEFQITMRVAGLNRDCICKIRSNEGFKNSSEKTGIILKICRVIFHQ